MIPLRIVAIRVQLDSPISHPHPASGTPELSIAAQVDIGPPTASAKVGLLFPWAERLAEAVRGLPDSPSSAADKMWAMNRLATAFFQADEELMPVLVEFWAYALHSPKATESFRDLFQAMQESYAAIIEEGVANGEFKPVDVQTISALPFAVLDGVIVLASLLDRNVVQPEKVVEQAQQLVFDGLLVKERDGQ